MMRRHAIALIVAGVLVIAAEARWIPGMAIIILPPGFLIAALPSIISATLSGLVTGTSGAPSSGIDLMVVETVYPSVWPTIMAVLFWWGVTFSGLWLIRRAA